MNSNQTNINNIFLLVITILFFQCSYVNGRLNRPSVDENDSVTLNKERELKQSSIFILDGKKTLIKTLTHKKRECKKICKKDEECFAFQNDKVKTDKWVCKKYIVEQTDHNSKKQKSIHDNRTNTKKHNWSFYQSGKTDDKYCAKDHSEKTYNIDSHEDCQKKCEDITGNSDDISCIISYSKLTKKKQKCTLTTTSNQSINETWDGTCVNFTRLSKLKVKQEISVIEDNTCPCFTKPILEEFIRKKGENEVLCDSKANSAFIGVEMTAPPTYTPTEDEPTDSPTTSERRLLSYNSRRRTTTSHDAFVMSYEAYVEDQDYSSNFCVKEGDLLKTTDKAQAEHCVSLIKEQLKYHGLCEA